MNLATPFIITTKKKTSTKQDKYKSIWKLIDSDTFIPYQCYYLRSLLIKLPAVLKRSITSVTVFSLALLQFAWLNISAATTRLDDFPSIILWAWERPEDLRFLDNKKYGVAFLAQTLQLTSDELVFVPRRQPLKVSPATRLIAVTRIETVKSKLHAAVLSDTQSDEAIRLVLRTLTLKNVSAVQIDFDAKWSERTFYRRFLETLRTRLPESIPLSITALASFCIGDSWIKDLPVDEAVPMIFRMGADTRRVKQFLQDGNDFPVLLCRHSYGVAIDEPLQFNFAKLRRLYVFKGRSQGWTQEDIENLQ
jgi:hypothetical protein